MFDPAIDSKLRGCDIVKIKTGDLVSGGRIRSRAIVIQQKTGRPVQFELLEPARGPPKTYRPQTANSPFIPNAAVRQQAARVAIPSRSRSVSSLSLERQRPLPVG